MKKIILTLCALTASMAVWCAQPSDESVTRLLEVTRADKLMDSVLPAFDRTMRQSVADAVKGRLLQPEHVRLLEGTLKEVNEVFQQEFNWTQMRPLYVQLYKETFSQEEVDGLIAFYQSPTGQAMVEKMPLVMQKSSTLMQSRMTPMVEKMRAIIQKSAAQVGTPR